ncbi:MAG: 16S rRNA (guanine(527)-N(7))-methyltransferase RsmG [Burkholderiaceae bacterium]|nr:16S rRNA (guanine(527)-N(7))-methyltransferase RsmG [Burkholderiaceae bacterium]
MRERLLAGLAELGLDSTLADRLLDYLALLVKWNGVYNLTAVREPAAMLRQHLLDSLSIVAPLAARLPQRDGAPAGRIIDVGSGAGLPGIVLALAWPRAKVVLVEPIGKKAAFLRQCQGELALTNLRVEATRIESLGEPEAGQPPDLVVCRAFASLADFATAIDRLVGPHTVIAAMKGAAPDDEVAALPAHWTVTEVLPLRVPELDAARHLVLMQRRP